MHQIVPPANRILNEGTPWSSYVMDADDQQDPQPSDSYDGANVGDNVSWGVVDDTCDGVIGASLVVDGVRHTAVTRVFSSCPDFSPDRRPFYSLVDDLNDRDLPPVEVDAASLEAVEDEAGELFRRVLDTMSQMNVDATRAHGIDENSEHFALGKDFPKLPKIDQRSMTAEDKPYADKIPDLIPPGPPREDSPAVRAEELPYTEAARQIHGPLSDIETLLDFLRSRGDHVRMLLRPPFGRLRQLAEKPGPRPNPSFRDPRVERDTLQDMRMPPYMRDSDETPLSLSWRQYDMLLKLIDHLAKQPGQPPGPTARRVARHAARRGAAGGAGRPHMTTDKKGLRPRNLTARSSYAVAGNPATAYPEDAVANCYPGLELDIRNFDRRFFPGLVFEFVARDDVDAAYSLPHRYGARLSYVETDQDPELQLPEAAKLLADLTGDAGSRLGDGVWYLEWLEQDGRRISMRWRRDGALMPMDGLWVWRLVRGLEPLPKPLRIGLRQRPESEPGAAEAAKRGKPDEVVLEGFRRTFQDPTSGVISTVYQPGELLQSLCSPWQHDFRDCACHYWASNHPDVVLGEVLPGEPTLPGDLPKEPEPAQVLLDWLRADRRRAVAASALDTIGKNRPFQLDAFQINHAWHELAVVLNDTELDGLYVPDALASANPFASPAELAKELRERLAPLEMTLAIEYLYARFSIIDPKQAPKGRWPGLADDVVFVRDYLMLVSVSEMTHMRWANQLLWELYEHGLVPSYEPVLEPALEGPHQPGRDARPGAQAPRALRCWTISSRSSGPATSSTAPMPA